MRVSSQEAGRQPGRGQGPCLSGGLILLLQSLQLQVLLPKQLLLLREEVVHIHTALQ